MLDYTTKNTTTDRHGNTPGMDPDRIWSGGRAGGRGGGLGGRGKIGTDRGKILPDGFG
jgi:hypothetical protein